ncbi:hypothetical protein LEMLEM_LOCUS14454, partial [Lemmus lemmus]
MRFGLFWAAGIYTEYCIHINKYKKRGAGEMDQWLRALPAIPKVLSSFPATTWWLTTIGNVVWCPLLACRHTHRQ